MPGSRKKKKFSNLSQYKTNKDVSSINGANCNENDMETNNASDVKVTSTQIVIDTSHSDVTVDSTKKVMETSISPDFQATSGVDCNTSACTRSTTAVKSDNTDKQSDQSKQACTLSKESTSRDIEIISGSNVSSTPRLFYFNPPDYEWQQNMCQLMNLYYIQTVRVPYSGIGGQLLDSFRVEHITPDGNCFFRCLSYVLSGTQDHHARLRTLIIDYIRLHKKKAMNYYVYSPLPSRTRSREQTQRIREFMFDRHLNKVSIPGSGIEHWATQVEVVAAASMLKLDICMFQVVAGSDDAPVWGWQRWSARALLGQAGSDTDHCLYMKNSRRIHYDVVIDSRPVYAVLAPPVDDASDYKSMDNNDSKNDSICAGCGKTFKRINSHLARNTKCKILHEQSSTETNISNEKRKAYKRQRQAVYRENETDEIAAKRIRYQRNYDNANKEEIVYKQRKYNSAYKEEIVHKQRKYDSAHKEEIVHKQRNYNSANKEEIVYKQRKYDSAHKEEIVHKQRNYNSANKEEIVHKQRNYNSANKEEIVNKQRKYNSAHKEEIVRKQEQYNKINQTNIACKQKLYDTTLKKNIDECDRLQNFRKEVKYGPIFPCTVCHRQLFKSGVCLINDTLMKTINKRNMYDKCVTEIPQSSIVQQHNEQSYVCHTCKNHLTKGKMPPMCVKNGLMLDDIPPQLELSELGQILISKSILFFKFFKLPKSRWSAIKDKMVHVPITDDDILATLSSLESLPRMPDQAGLIPVQLKRKVEYKSYVLEAFIEPKKLIDALMVLKESGHPGYKDVQINENYSKQIPTEHEVNEKELENELEIDAEQFDKSSDEAVNLNNSDMDEVLSSDHKNCPDVSDDDDDEDNNIRQYQSNDLATMMSDDHPEIRISKTQNDKSPTDSLSLAPGQGKIPTNLMREDDWDINSFPTLFPTGRYGMNYARAIKLAPWKYISQRLYNVDKRFVSSNPYLFAGLYYLERHQIEQQIHVSYLKGNVSSSGELKGIEDALSVLEQIPGSPRYWKKQRHIMFAKLENLGPFLFFYTLSCADKRWTENFTSVLSQKGYNITYEMKEGEEFVYVNNELLEDMLKREKVHELLCDNIDIVTRNFNQRVRAFVKNIMMGANNPMYIEYYNYRVEFQARGAGHIHGVAWPQFKKLEVDYPGITSALKSLRDHETLNIEQHDSVVKMIDAFISCRLNSDVKDIVSEVQIHRHSKSCRKYGTKCRFNFPRYPSERTLVAQVLDRSAYESDDIYRKELRKHQEVLQSVKEILYDLEEKKQLDETSISDLLIMAKVSSDDYYKALEVTNKGTVVILKRAVNEIYVNNYNPEWLRAWNGNMDIQICLDYYAVITYITDYYMKDDSGTMKFLIDAAKECRDRGLAEQMRFLANVFLTHRGKGSFEALYSIDPSLHLTDSNIKAIWIDTNFPDKRRQFLVKIADDNDNDNDNDDDHDNENDIDEKGGPVLNTADSTSDDENYPIDSKSSSKSYITIPGKEGKYVKRSLSLHDKYKLRPDALSKITFAQFCTMYDTYPRSRVGKDKVMINGVHGTSDIRIVTPDEDYLENLPSIIKINDSIYMKIRRKPSVMRQRKPREDKEPHEFAYSELLLYLPWRDERELYYDDIDACLILYENKVHELFAVKTVLFPHQNNVEAGRAFIEANGDPHAHHIGEMLDPAMEQEQDEQKAIGQEVDEEYIARNPEGIVNARDNDNMDIGSIYRRIDVSDRDRMRKDVRELDPDQRYAFKRLVKYFKNVRKASKLGKSVVDPPLDVIHGGAGSGKSLLIRVISEWAEALLRKDDDRNPDQPIVILAAFTGVAASNIKGLTLHTAFGLSFGNAFYSLSDKKRDETRALLEKLKLIIIDEISMVKSDQLYQINLRLQEVMGNQLPFGGLAVLLFGDMLQLRPIFAGYIFEKPMNEKFANSYEFRSLWDLFSFIVLRYNHRQGDYKYYADALGRIRYGLREPEDMKMLTSRVRSSVPIDGIHLCGTNAEVNEFNEARLEELPGTERTIMAINLHPTQKSYTPKIGNDGTVNGTPFQNVLKLKEDARVIVTYNIDIKDRLVNGASGIVRKIIMKPNTDVVSEVIVEFDDDEVGKTTRCVQKRKDNLTSIKKMSYFYSLGKKNTDHVTQLKVLQFPLKLAWASTVHKFQGQTIKSPTILVGHMEKIRAASQAYVLFGRVQTIEQLYLTCFDEKMIHVDEKALALAKRISIEALNVQTNPWHETDASSMKVIQLNVRSLQKHFDDIVYDIDVMSADIICLTETWLQKNQSLAQLQVNGYQMITCSVGRGKGVALYVKQDVVYSDNFEKVINDNFQIISVQHTNFDIICVYRSPGSNILEFVRAIIQQIKPNRNTVLVGDTNINALDNNVLEAALDPYDMKQIINESTHIDGGLLDHVYVNFECVDKFIHPLYYSDHDATCIKFMP